MEYDEADRLFRTGRFARLLASPVDASQEPLPDPRHDQALEVDYDLDGTVRVMDTGSSHTVRPDNGYDELIRERDSLRQDEPPSL